MRSRRLHPRGVALRRRQRLQGLVRRGQLHGGTPHLRGQQLPVSHGSLRPPALDVRRGRRLPGRLGRGPPILRYASALLYTAAASEGADNISVLGFQRGPSATASCAPTTPAFLPPPTATASRSVRTAPTSRTAVSARRFGRRRRRWRLEPVLKRCCSSSPPPPTEPLCTRYMEFVCRNRAQCLFQSLVCDGAKHCEDGSDEDAQYAGCGEPSAWRCHANLC